VVASDRHHVAHALSQQLEHPIFLRREEHAGTVDGHDVGGEIDRERVATSRLKRVPGRDGREFQISDIGAET
jgi:hypothetical protein